jgi:hypothetical protein
MSHDNLANTLGVVKRNTARADRAAALALSRFGVATIHDDADRTGSARDRRDPGCRPA